MAVITKISQLSDLSTFPAPTDRVVTGMECVLEWCARALGTAKGGLWYAPTFGFAVRAFLHKRDTAATRYELQSGIAAALEQHPMILEAQVVVNTISRDEIAAEIVLDTTDGPWAGVLSVDDLTLELIPNG